MTGFLKQQARKFNTIPTPFVSVIVPARNEEGSIENCVRALANSDYPADKFEIIVVNDRSTDATLKVLQKLQSVVSQLRIINKESVSSLANLQGKPGAIQEGADVSLGEILLMTDADCVVPEAWIRMHVAAIETDNCGLVAGFTAVAGSKLTDRLQDVEWLFTQAMAAGGVGHNLPLGCFGNNLSVKSSVFKELGGYRSIPFSITEDMALQKAVFERGYSVRHICQPGSTVVTQPCATVAEYINQHHRWARGGMGLGGKAIGFVITSLMLWTSLLYSLLSSQYEWLAVLLAIKMLGDGTLTAMTIVSMKRKGVLLYVLPSLFFLLLTELSLPMLILRRSVTWKNQIFKN
ncbi:MAG: glycosyltransferase [Ignavibacteria bacterium]|nr:glycosyltransferase [Ignavibacteria bacterium]